MRCSLLTLSCYIDDELEVRRRGEMEAHLVGCPRCRAGLSHLREEVERVGGLARVRVPDPSARAILEVVGVLGPDDTLPPRPSSAPPSPSLASAPWLTAGSGGALPWAAPPRQQRQPAPEAAAGEPAPATPAAAGPWQPTPDFDVRSLTPPAAAPGRTAEEDAAREEADIDLMAPGEASAVALRASDGPEGGGEPSLAPPPPDDDDQLPLFGDAGDHADVEPGPPPGDHTDVEQGQPPGDHADVEQGPPPTALTVAAPTPVVPPPAPPVPAQPWWSRSPATITVTSPAADPQLSASAAPQAPASPPRPTPPSEGALSVPTPASQQRETMYPMEDEVARRALDHDDDAAYGFGGGGERQGLDDLALALDDDDDDGGSGPRPAPRPRMFERFRERMAMRRAINEAANPDLDDVEVISGPGAPVRRGSARADLARRRTEALRPAGAMVRDDSTFEPLHAAPGGSPVQIFPAPGRHFPEVERGIGASGARAIETPVAGDRAAHGLAGAAESSGLRVGRGTAVARIDEDEAGNQAPIGHLRGRATTTAPLRPWAPLAPPAEQPGKAPSSQSDGRRLLVLYVVAVAVLLVVGLLSARTTTPLSGGVVSTSSSSQSTTAQAPVVLPPVSQPSAAAPQPTPTAVPAAPPQTLGSGGTGYTVAGFRFGDHTSYYRIVLDLTGGTGVTPDVTVTNADPQTVDVTIAGTQPSASPVTAPGGLITRIALVTPAPHAGSTTYRISLSRAGTGKLGLLAAPVRIVVDIS